MKKKEKRKRKRTRRERDACVYVRESRIRINEKHFSHRCEGKKTDAKSVPPKLTNNFTIYAHNLATAPANNQLKKLRGASRHTLIGFSVRLRSKFELEFMSKKGKNASAISESSHFSLPASRHFSAQLFTAFFALLRHFTNVLTFR